MAEQAAAPRAPASPDCFFFGERDLDELEATSGALLENFPLKVRDAADVARTASGFALEELGQLLQHSLAKTDLRVFDCAQFCETLAAAAPFPELAREFLEKRRQVRAAMQLEPNEPALSKDEHA